MKIHGDNDSCRLVFDCRLSQVFEAHFDFQQVEMVLDRQYPGEEFNFSLKVLVHLQPSRSANSWLSILNPATVYSSPLTPSRPPPILILHKTNAPIRRTSGNSQEVLTHRLVLTTVFTRRSFGLTEKQMLVSLASWLTSLRASWLSTSCS